MHRCWGNRGTLKSRAEQRRIENLERTIVRYMCARERVESGEG